MFGAIRHILLLSRLGAALHVLPFSVGMVDGLTSITVTPGGKLIPIPPVLTAFAVTVKVTGVLPPEHIADGLTARLTWENASDTNDKLVSIRIIEETRNWRKDTFIKRLVLSV